MNQLKFSDINWVNTVFLIGSPILAISLTSLHLYLDGFMWQIWALALFMYLATGFGITAGYHRLFAHRAYKANSFMKLMYLLFGAAAVQNSALKWCTDHRRHHLKEDTEDDPYAINNGFFYAHMGWVMLESDNKYDRAAKDLAADKLVAWQDKYYLSILVVMGFLLPILVGYFMGSALGAFAVACWLRIVFVHHCTFFINSLCHYWGKQTYSDKITARDNPLLALFTYGEGFHNFHHKFQADYRNGLRWYHYDPTKWLIISLSKLGWAFDLKKTPDEAIFRAKLDTQQKLCLNKTKFFEIDSTQFETKLNEMREKVEVALQRWFELKAEYKRLKRELPEQGRAKFEEMRAELKEEMKRSKEEYKLAYSQWKTYIKQRQNFA